MNGFPCMFPSDMKGGGERREQGSSLEPSAALSLRPTVLRPDAHRRRSGRGLPRLVPDPLSALGKPPLPRPSEPAPASLPKQATGPSARRPRNRRDRGIVTRPSSESESVPITSRDCRRSSCGLVSTTCEALFKDWAEELLLTERGSGGGALQSGADRCSLSPVGVGVGAGTFSAL